MKKVMTGTETAAIAAQYARVQVVSAYPITPQTMIVEKLSEIIGSGELKARYINVESEHSAMAACIGASAAGARVYTATSSQGLALMHEVLHYAAGARLPVVMANANRGLTPPWNMYCDHGDALAQRDTGWLQYFCADCQDVFDATLIAYRVAEQALLPVMLNLDAFYLTHTSEVVELPEQESADRYLPPYVNPHTLDLDNPFTFGNVCGQEYYTSFKFNLQRETLDAAERWQEASKEFEAIFGRPRPVIEAHRTQDAELVFCSLGTASGTLEAAADLLRIKGVKAGSLRIALMRPLPVERIIPALKGVNELIVLDRDISLGSEGILAHELKAALYGRGADIKISGLIGGIGGQDIRSDDFTAQVLEYKKTNQWPGRRLGQSTWTGVLP